MVFSRSFILERGVELNNLNKKKNFITIFSKPLLQNDVLANKTLAGFYKCSQLSRSDSSFGIKQA